MVVSILIIGFILRLINLSGKPLWYDEASSVAYAQKNILYILRCSYGICYKCTYPLILKIWGWVFGYKEFSVRFLSLLFGVVAVYFIYRLGRSLYNQTTGLIAALLLSVSPMHIFYSQQARHYTLSVALTIVSFYFFFKVLLKPVGKNVVLNIIANFLLLTTHPYGITIVASQLFAFIFYYQKLPKNIVLLWFFSQTAVVTLYVKFLIFPSRGYLLEKIWWIPKIKIKILGELFMTLMTGLPRYGLDDYPLPATLLTMPFIFSPGFIILLAIGLKRLYGHKGLSENEKMSNSVVAIWLFVPILIACTVSFIKPVFLIKHLIFILPPFIVIAALGMRDVKNRLLKKLLILLVIVSSFASLRVIYTKDLNINWRNPAEYISKNIAPKETILVLSGKEIVPFLYYFDYQREGVLKKIDIYGKIEDNNWEEVFYCGSNIIVGLKQQTKDHPLDPLQDFIIKFNENKLDWKDRNIWVAISSWGEADNFHKILEVLSRTHAKKEEIQFGRVRVYYWKIL